MPGRSIAGRPYPDDDGSADPRVAAALAAYAAGGTSEHAALSALAASRLLVPVVAMLTEETAGPKDGARGNARGAGREDDAAGAAPAGRAGELGGERWGLGAERAGGLGGERAGGLGGEKASEMALPTLIGRDGRPALVAFTCLDSLARWRPGARPVPVPAAGVWRAGAEQASAVVIDVAGPVPVAVDGARLIALANGEAVPPPHEDPDVVTLVRQMVAREHVITGFRVLPGEPGTDMTLHVTLAPGHAAADALPQEAIGRVVAGIMAGAGHSLRRGLNVAVSEAAPLDRKAGGQ